MPTELEELVDFLHHGNTPIRQVATHNLVPFSEKKPSIFKSSQLTPVKDLKLLVNDYESVSRLEANKTVPIAKDALTILINISNDSEVLKALYEDESFLETILLRITNPKEPNANELAMLLANMSKNDGIERLLTLKRVPPISLTKSKLAIDQLMDIFVKGAEGSYNEKADFDYLAYVFADLGKFPASATYFTTEQSYDSLHPLAKLLPFSSHKSLPRRLGVTSALKNISFTLPTHPVLFDPPVAVLPFILLPLASGADNYTSEETDELPEELQLLDDSVRRERNHIVLMTHLETLLLLTSTRFGRDFMREHAVYYVIRECHLAVEDDEMREACQRLVNMLMRDEEGGDSAGWSRVKDAATGEGARRKSAGAGGGGGGGSGGGMMVTQRKDSDDEDDKVTEIAL